MMFNGPKVQKPRVLLKVEAPRVGTWRMFNGIPNASPVPSAVADSHVCANGLLMAPHRFS